jgi:hypothetical protein
MDKRSVHLQTSQRNIDRYQRLLETELSAVEFRLVERRLSEERFSVAMLQFMISGRSSASEIRLPDALQ